MLLLCSTQIFTLKLFCLCLIPMQTTENTRGALHAARIGATIPWGSTCTRQTSAAIPVPNSYDSSSSCHEQWHRWIVPPSQHDDIFSTAQIFWYVLISVCRKTTTFIFLFSSLHTWIVWNLFIADANVSFVILPQHSAINITNAFLLQKSAQHKTNIRQLL